LPQVIKGLAEPGCPIVLQAPLFPDASPHPASFLDVTFLVVADGGVVVFRY
jgi:hypothetical protein